MNSARLKINPPVPFYYYCQADWREMAGNAHAIDSQDSIMNSHSKRLFSNVLIRENVYHEHTRITQNNPRHPAGVRGGDDVTGLLFDRRSPSSRRGRRHRRHRRHGSSLRNRHDATGLHHVDFAGNSRVACEIDMMQPGCSKEDVDL